MFNVRETLDNFMWLVAHDESPVPLDTRQERGLCLPLRTAEEAWATFVRSPQGRAIRPKLLERLEAVQLLRLPDGSGLRGLTMMEQLHNIDAPRPGRTAVRRRPADARYRDRGRRSGE